MDTLTRRAAARADNLDLNLDANLQFTRCSCAGWAADVIGRKPTLTAETLKLAFWISELDPEGPQNLLDLFLKRTDQERLLPEIKKAWGQPEELASIVHLVTAKSDAGRDRKLRSGLVDRLRKWASARPDFGNCSLAQSLEKTRGLFGLSEAETEFCFFFAAQKWWEEAQDFFDIHLHCDEPRGRSALVVALGFDKAALVRVLSGKLFTIGIFHNDKTWLRLQDEFLPYFVDPSQAPVSQDLFRSVPAPELHSDELGLDREAVELAKDLLVGDGDIPVHILLYGPPGTGKTSLARALCAELDLRGFEVLAQSDNRAGTRRAALAACLEMASGRPDSLVLVDEADNLISTDRPWFHSGEVMDKGYLNNILEQNGSRGIWIVNEHDGIDPAVRRRFAFSLEMPPLSRGKRAAMLEATLRRHRIKRHFSTDQIRALADEFSMAPALFALGARVAAGSAGSAKKSRSVFRKVLGSQVRLMGGAPSRPKTRNLFPLGFLEDGINADRPLEQVRQQVKTFDRSWRNPGENAGWESLGLLFHGMPGTGKTATAQHLADLLDRPIISKRASDLLDPYVGMTERRIAQAFAQASDEGAVLVIDEVDTFLGRRSGAQRSWEVSKVNEVLVQIEQHRGLVICTTNRLEGLDEAALRRFPLKIEFRPLDSGQIMAMYAKVLGPIAKGKLSRSQMGELRSLEPVTVADMALVRRNREMIGCAGTPHARLIAELGKEVAMKPGQRQGKEVVGFG